MDNYSKKKGGGQTPLLIFKRPEPLKFGAFLRLGTKFRVWCQDRVLKGKKAAIYHNGHYVKQCRSAPWVQPPPGAVRPGRCATRSNLSRHQPRRPPPVAVCKVLGLAVCIYIMRIMVPGRVFFCCL